MNKAQKEVLQAHLDEEKRIIRQLKLVYGQAQDDCINKIIDLSRRRDMENLQSIIYQRQYQEALKKQLDGILDSLQSEEFVSIADYLQKSYHNGYVGVMYDLHKQGIPIIMPINQEQVVKALKTDSKISSGLYSRLGEDTSYLKRSIRAELSRGIANGSTWNEMAEHIAKGMNSPFKKAYNNAIRITRTEGHRIQQRSALDAQYVAKEKGADIVKQWDSTLDNRTRPHHRMLDGQIRELEEDFEVDGMKASAPGYFGRASEDCNCRCCILQRAKWALDEEELSELKERAGFFGLDKTKDFEDFKAKYLDAQKKILEINLQFFASKSDKSIVEERISQGIISKKDFEESYQYFKRTFDGGIKTPIEKVSDKKDMFWHIVKGHQEMMTKRNIDRIAESLKEPSIVLKTKDKFGNSANCYILEKDGYKTLISIVRNDIITSYEPSEKYLKKQLKEGELLWKNSKKKI